MLKKYFKRAMLLLLVMLSLAIISPKQANAAWRQNNTGWWYADLNSWATGWKYINGQWYYFYPSGYMAADTIIEGYYVNPNGQWVENYSLYNNININPSNFNNANIGPVSNFNNVDMGPLSNYNDKKTKPSQDFNNRKTRPSTKHSDVKTTSLQNYIDKEKIKQIVLNHAGINSNAIRHMSVEFDYENGNAIYEVDFKIGYIEYEYDVNATTGEIIHYSSEYDD